MDPASSPPPPHPPPSQYSEALRQRMMQDTCFTCKNKGHWSQDCPAAGLSSPGGSPSKSSSDSRDIPLMHCKCGDACAVRTAKTPRNLNRQFFCCPKNSQLPGVERCKLFAWCDEFTAPLCPCGAGRCRIYMDPQNCKKYFGCRIRKGHGACNFFQWIDERRPVMALPQPQRMEIEPPAMVNSGDSTELDLLYGEKKLDEIMLNLSGPDHSNDGDLPGKVTEDGTGDLRGLVTENGGGDLQGTIMEAESGTTSPDSVVEDLTMEEIAVLDQITQNEMVISHTMFQESEIHRQQEDLMKQILSVGEDLTQDTVNLILDRQVMGWCGRIAFRPSKWMREPPPKPLFCCIFPSLFAMMESDDGEVIAGRGHNLLTHVPSGPRLNDHLSESFLPSDPPCPKTDDEQVMQLLVWLAQLLNGGATNQLSSFKTGGRYAEILQRTAAEVRNEFIAQLDWIDPFDLELLKNEAVVCFAMLGLLRAMDCGEFICRVMQYIECASSLVKIESSLSPDPSSKLQELRERHAAEQKHCEGLSQLHAEKLNAYSASQGRLKGLQENAARVREMLMQIEREVAECEAESVQLERCLVEVNQEVKKSRRTVEVTAQEVGEAQRIEVERSAAKAALAVARSQLRPAM